MKYYDAKTLSGFNIYQVPEKGQTIYCDRFTKKYYIIDNRSVIAFSNWRLRLPLSILIIGIMAMLKIDLKIDIVVGVVCYIGATIFFYVRFLPQLKEIANFKKPTYKSPIHAFAARFTRMKLVKALSTCIALIIIIIVAVFTSKFTETVKYVALAMIAAAIIAGAAIFYLINLKFTDPQLRSEEEKYLKLLEVVNATYGRDQKNKN